MLNSRKVGGLVAVALLLISGSVRAQYVQDPNNGHFYKFVELGVFSTLSQALDDVANQVGPNGGQCYVATVTSQDEANFIFNSVIQPIQPAAFLLGASDSEFEGRWKWINGPEDGFIFWDSGPVAGVYNNWNPGEPSGGADQMVSAGLGWNDGTNFNGAGNPAGYVAECGDFFRNPNNGHFYKFVELGVLSTLPQALDDVANQVGPNGGQCYVATVTSQDEANFIFNSVIQPIQPAAFLLGASDSEFEGRWKWINGPEDGLIFWDSGPVAGVYNNWNPGEPSGDADQMVSAGLGWNDGINSNGAGNPAGYVAECDQFVVMNTNDAGAGSLRQAIIDANDNPSPNTITFDPAAFPPTDPCAAPYVPIPPLPHEYFGPYGPDPEVAALGTIVLASRLPHITGEGDSIDGSGACVVLDGKDLALGSDTGLRVRASDVTIQNLTLQNFLLNDAIRVEARDDLLDPSDQEVTGVLIASNQFYRNVRAVRVTGGLSGTAKTVSATVTGNMIQDVESGIQVLGNLNNETGPGNEVTALIDDNLVQGTFTPTESVRGDGISVLAAVDEGSYNVVDATVSNNTVRDVIDEGISAGGCGNFDTGSENVLDVTITGNTVAYFVNSAAPPEIDNNGITVFGAGGESSLASACTDNTVTFLISNNTVNGFPNRNIVVLGGDEQTSGHQVSGDIENNTVMKSPGNPLTPTPGGDGIVLSGGSGTGNMLHNINICSNKSSQNFGRGIVVTGGSGDGNFVQDINICGGNVFRDNGDDGIGIVGGSGSNNTVTAIDVVGNNLSGNDDGILIAGGILSQHTTVSDVFIGGNQSNRNLRDGIRVTRGPEETNMVSLFGITDNSFSANARDGIGISINVAGAGNTPISGNRADRNGEDGIDLDSSGYDLSNNRANKNDADGINAFGVGNTKGNGNKGKANGACNQPTFC